MAKITVHIYNPLGPGEVTQQVIEGELINVTEVGAYTVAGCGHTGEVTVPGVEGETDPHTYTQSYADREIRVPTNYVTRIDIEYDSPEVQQA